MSKLFVTKSVIDKYMSGMTLNEAIQDEYAEQIMERTKDNAILAKMTPLQIVMHDAGITRNSKVEQIMNTAYTSGGMETNEWLFPAWVETTLRETALGQNIISYLCDTTIPVDTNVIKSPMLDLTSAKNKPALKMARVAEGADLPTGKIVIGEKAVSLYKHGRAIEMTYESMRRMRIDLFLRQLNAIINDVTFQNVDDATETLVNGDGNDNAATKLGTTGTAGTITAAEIIGFLTDYWFDKHFAADTLIAPKNLFKTIKGFSYDINLQEGASATVRFNTPQLQQGEVTLLTSNVPQISGKDVILVYNRANTLVRYEENGSNIQENQNFARNQTRLLTVSENSGYAINTLGANTYIEIKAS